MSTKKQGSIEILDGFPKDVVAIEYRGYIDSDDYEKVLIPEIESRIAQEGKVKLLAIIGKDYEGVSAGAAWDDLKFGLLHLGDFPRIALVTDKKGLRKALKIFAPLMRSEVRVFGLDELDAAREWITRNVPPVEPETEAEAEARRRMQQEAELILPIEQ